MGGLYHRLFIILKGTIKLDLTIAGSRKKETYKTIHPLTYNASGI